MPSWARVFRGFRSGRIGLLVLPAILAGHATTFVAAAEAEHSPTSRVVSLMQKGRATFLLREDLPAESAVVRWPGVKSVRRTSVTKTFGVSFDEARTSPAGLFSEMKRSGIPVEGLLLTFEATSELYEQACGAKGLATFNRMQTQPGVRRIQRFFNGDGRIELVVDPEVLTEQAALQQLRTGLQDE